MRLARLSRGGRTARGRPIQFGRYHRLVVRAMEAQVSIALIDPAGQALFREAVNWADYSREIFDRCLARPQGNGVPVRSGESCDQPKRHPVSHHLPSRTRGAEAIIRAQIGRTIPVDPEEVTLGCMFRPSMKNRLEVIILAGQRAWSSVSPLLATPHRRDRHSGEASGRRWARLVVPFGRCMRPSEWRTMP